MRVLDISDPNHSLILVKPTRPTDAAGNVDDYLATHNGGQRWPGNESSRQYKTILEWIRGVRIDTTQPQRAGSRRPVTGRRSVVSCPPSARTRPTTRSGSGPQWPLSLRYKKRMCCKNMRQLREPVTLERLWQNSSDRQSSSGGIPRPRSFFVLSAGTFATRFHIGISRNC